MKNITIRVDAPVLLEGSGVTHTGTSWQIASKPNFDILENIIDESLNDTVNLLKYFKKLDIKDSDTIYVRTKYHFSNDKEDSWSRIVSLKGNQQGITLSDVIVATPKVSLTKEKLLDNTENIIITTEPFKMFAGVGNHVSTSWVITDLDDNIVFNRPYDTDNKTSLIINSKILNKEKTYLIKCKHHTSTNMSSLEGKLTLSLYTLDNNYFDIKQLSKTVVNRMLYFKVLVFTMLYDSIDIMIKDKSGRIVKEKNNQTTVTPNIFLDNLIVFEKYDIYARIKLKNGSYTNYQFVSSNILEDNHLVIPSDDIEYVGEYDYLHKLLLNGQTVQASREFYNGTILLTKNNDKNIYRYRYCNDKLIELGKVIELPIADNVGVPYLNILPLHNGDVVINYSSDKEGTNEASSVFTKFTYNASNHKFKQTINRINKNELLSTAMSSSAVVDKFDNIYYIPAIQLGIDNQPEPLSLFKLNSDNLTVIKLAELPFTATNNVSLSITRNNELIIAGGSDKETGYVQDTLNGTWLRTNHDIYKYNIDTGIFTNIGNISTLPDSLYNFQSFLKRDGSIVYFNNVIDGSSEGNQSTFIVDPINNKVIVNTNDTDDNLIYRTSIVLQSGDILRISSLEEDPQVVLRYVSNTSYVEDIDSTTDIEDMVTNLIVPVNKVITVEDLYRYETITIEGTSMSDTGKLRWVTPFGIREFYYNDLIVTRDTVRQQDELNAALYNRVFILGNATLVNNWLEVPNELIVPQFQTIAIIDPMIYTKITIEGDNMTNTGKLIWHDNGIDREFYYNDLLITRNTESSPNDFETKSYRTIHIVGSTLTIG